MVSTLPQLHDTATGPRRFRSDSGQMKPSLSSDGQPSEYKEEIQDFHNLKCALPWQYGLSVEIQTNQIFERL